MQAARLTRDEICAAITAHENRGAWKRSVRWARGDEGAAWEGLYYVASLWKPGSGTRLFSWLYSWGPPNARKAALGSRTSCRLMNAQHIRLVSVSRARDKNGVEVDLLPELAVDRSAAEYDPDELEALDVAMAGLDAQTRTALELRYRDELTLERIGERLGVSQEGARLVIKRGLRRLRARIPLADPA